MRRSAATSWGLPLFFSGAIGCSGASWFLYLFATEYGGGTIPLLVDGLFCVPFALVSAVGAIQVVSGSTCNRLANVWPSLRLWRRILFALFVMGFLYFAAYLTYFSLTLAPPDPI